MCHILFECSKNIRVLGLECHLRKTHQSSRLESSKNDPKHLLEPGVYRFVSWARKAAGTGVGVRELMSPAEE